MPYSDTYVDAHRIRAMWCEVLWLAVQDAVDPSHGIHGYVNSRNAVKRQARAWFSLNNPDFIVTCDLAGQDPHFIYERTQKAIKNHDTLQRLIGGYRKTLHPAVGTGAGRREKAFDNANRVNGGVA